MKQFKSLRFNLFMSCLSVLILCCVTILHAQEKQKIPVEFFIGKWAGEIEGVVQGCLPCWYNRKHQCPKNPPWHPFRIELIGNGTDADMKVQAKYPPVSFQARGGVGFVFPEIIMILTDVGDPISIPMEALGFVTVLYNGGFKVLEASEKTIKLTFGALDKPKDMQASAEFYRVELLKKAFPKDIKPNEPIKTDKRTQLEITMPSKDVIKVAQNTEAVIRSESLMEVVKGKIHGLIKKLKPKTKFEVHTPTAIIGIRGTEYEISVEDDGTTTVVVFDGEVELSDKENKKTVIVKKNQISICKPKGLPSDPYGFNQDQILKWWK